MEENRDQDPNLKEIVISLICGQEILVETLVEKGLLTREDYWNKMNEMKAKRNALD